MGYLDQFTKSVRIAYPSIRLGVAQGLNATTIMKGLSVAGMGIRNKVGLKVIKAVKSAMRDTSLYLPEDITQPPVPELIPPSLTKQTKRYRWTIGGRMFNPSIDAEYDKHVNIETNFLQPQEEIIEIGRELLAEDSGDFGAKVGAVWIAEIDDSFSPVIIPR